MGILKKLFFLLIFTLPFGELTRIQFENGAAFTLTDVIVSITVLYWFMKKGKTVFVVKNSLQRAVGFFIAACLIANFLSLFLFPFSQVAIGMLYLLRFVLYIQIIYIAGEFDKSSKEKIKTDLCIFGCIAVMIGYFQFFYFSNLKPLFQLGWDDHLYRLFGSFLDPNFSSAFFVLVFLLLMEKTIKSFEKKEKNIRALYLGASTLSLFAVFLTYSRSGYIMLLVSVITFLFLQGKKKWVGGMLLVTLFFILLNVKNFNVENINLFRSVSTQARLETTKNALKIIQKHPIFGIGFNNYRYAQIKYGTRLPVTKYVSHADAGTDNSFLFVLATTGIIGLFAYIFFWKEITLSAWNNVTKCHSGNPPAGGASRISSVNPTQGRSWTSQDDKRKRSMSIILLSSIIGLFVNALFINSLFYPFIMLWMWIVIGILL